MTLVNRRLLICHPHNFELAESFLFPHLQSMSLTLTLILTALSVGLTILCGWRGAKPTDIMRAKPRMMPWRFLMLLFAALTMLLLIHVVNLLGGNPKTIVY